MATRICGLHEACYIDNRRRVLLVRRSSTGLQICLDRTVNRDHHPLRSYFYPQRKEASAKTLEYR